MLNKMGPIFVFNKHFNFLKLFVIFFVTNTYFLFVWHLIFVIEIFIFCCSPFYCWKHRRCVVLFCLWLPSVKSVHVTHYQEVPSLKVVLTPEAITTLSFTSTSTTSETKAGVLRSEALVRLPAGGHRLRPSSSSSTSFSSSSLPGPSCNL